MKKNEMVIIVCRILSVYLAVLAASQLQWLSVISFMGNFSSTVEPFKIVSLAFIFFVFYISSSVLLWKKAKWISNSLLEDLDPTDDLPSPNASTIQAIAFSVVGLLTLTDVFPAFLKLIVKYYSLGHMSGHYPPIAELMGRADWHGDIASMIARLCLGIWLFFESPGLVRLWKKIRASYRRD